MAGAQGADPEVLKKKIHIYIGRNRIHQKNQKITGRPDEIRIVFNLFSQII